MARGTTAGSAEPVTKGEKHLNSQASKTQQNMNIAREFWFSMGHTLHAYNGKCANLHGHNYRLVVSVYTDELDAQGMVLDFGDLKDIVSSVIDRDYDHRFLINEKDERAAPLKALDSTVAVVPFNPTAEMLAGRIKEQIQAQLPDLTVSKLTLWETENSYAEI